MRLLFPFFAGFFFIFSMLMRSYTKDHKQMVRDFLARESDANSTRKKNIDNLDYITIPWDMLPQIDNISEKVSSYMNSLLTLKDARILNLTGITNTELKLTYGAANLTPLSEYDENYTRLCNTFVKLSSALIEEERLDEAMAILEIAVDAGCDNSVIFTNLATIYKEKGIDKKTYLVTSITSSSSYTKSSTLKKVEAILNS